MVYYIDEIAELGPIEDSLRAYGYLLQRDRHEDFLETEVRTRILSRAREIVLDPQSSAPGFAEGLRMLEKYDNEYLLGIIKNPDFDHLPAEKQSAIRRVLEN